MLVQLLVNLRCLAPVAFDVKLVKVKLKDTVKVLIQSGAHVSSTRRAVLVAQRNNTLFAENHVALRTFSRVSHNHRAYLALKFL